MTWCIVLFKGQKHVLRCSAWSMAVDRILYSALTSIVLCVELEARHWIRYLFRRDRRSYFVCMEPFPFQNLNTAALDFSYFHRTTKLVTCFTTHTASARVAERRIAENMLAINYSSRYTTSTIKQFLWIERPRRSGMDEPIAETREPNDPANAQMRDTRWASTYHLIATVLPYISELFRFGSSHTFSVQCKLNSIRITDFHNFF